MPAEWELVLDLGDSDHPHESICYYYFINCSNRTLFWLHELDVRPLLNGLFDVKSNRRIRESESLTSALDLTSDHWLQNKHWKGFIGKFLSENLSPGG